jgi:cell wall-associated NlpC family hydrolase
MRFLRFRRAAALAATTAVTCGSVLVSGGVATAATTTPGQRIVALAKQLVGSRYTYGGASPAQGFDCSGLTEWVYAHAGVATLPHNANAQRFAPRMHWVARANARPGDLVFYFSGSGQAYHVAIYAGHGMQYAATMPGEGVRYQIVWSRQVAYRTDWH